VALNGQEETSHMSGGEKPGVMPSFDVTVPNVARIYNYLLGGKDTYAADRQAAGELMRVIPESALAARQNRAFLRRAVEYLVREAGIRQFIDLGSGMPSMGNVHEVAHETDPVTRVVYVDFDPVVYAHGNAFLAEDDVIVLQADIRHPDHVLENSEVIRLIDFARPAAVLMIAIMHFIGDHERPLWIADQYKNRMAPGSYLAISHITDEDVAPENSKAAQQIYSNATAQVYPRSYGHILEFFEGTTLVAPGLVDADAWRNPGHQPGTNRRLAYGGIGRLDTR
jgi:S-adenosyl methyltransferase